MICMYVKLGFKKMNKEIMKRYNYKKKSITWRILIFNNYNSQEFLNFESKEHAYRINISDQKLIKEQLPDFIRFFRLKEINNSEPRPYRKPV